MQIVLTVLHLFLAIGLIGLVLIQHGRGADAGAAFGTGASATVFGARGAGSFLTRTTAILAALFFFTSIALAYFAAKSGSPSGGVMERVEVGAPLPVEGGAPVPPIMPRPVDDLPIIPGLGPGASGSTATGSGEGSVQPEGQ